MFDVYLHRHRYTVRPPTEVIAEKSNGETVSTRYSLQRHREESGIKRANRLSNKRNEMEPMRSFKATSTRLSHKTVSQEKLDERHNALYNELDEQGKSLHDRVFEEKARPVYRNTAFSVYIHRLRRHWHDTSRLLEKPMTMANQSSFFLVLLSSATTRAMLLLH